MIERKSIPRADNLCKIRDITYIFKDNRKNTTKEIFDSLEFNKVKPPKGIKWSFSNLREYISALKFLKLAIKISDGYYLSQKGNELKIFAQFKSEKLSGKEKEFFSKILFENNRFTRFLTFFTKGVSVNNHEDLVKYGHEISLKEKYIKQKAIDFFEYYDKREFSDRGVLLYWAMAIEIIEIDLENGTYFPTFHVKPSKKKFKSVLLKKYLATRDKKTLRVPIFKVRSRVCKELKITNNVFDKYLEELNRQIPHIVNLERAPLASFRSPYYGLIKENDEIYYYLRITGDINDKSI